MNKVIITNDYEKALKDIKYDVSFIRDELKIEDVNEIKKEAYIAEKHKKIILIAAKKYNIYAQNALLKILEESPKNIEFVLLSESKYNLLDTVLSRLVLEKIFYKEEEKKYNINNITNSLIFDLLKEDLEIKEIKEILKELLPKASSEEQLKIINDALMMLELNIDPKAVLSMVMLGFKERK